MRYRAEQIAAALLGALLLGLLTSSYWLAPLPAKASGSARQERPTIPPDRPTVPPPAPTDAPPPPTEAPVDDGGQTGEDDPGAEDPGHEDDGASEPGSPGDGASDPGSGPGRPGDGASDPGSGPGHGGTSVEEPGQAQPEALPSTLPSTGGSAIVGPLLAALGILALAVGLTLRRALS